MRKRACSVITYFALSAFACTSLAGDVESKILHADFGRAIASDIGADGRLLVYPSTWTTSQGKDGRKTAHPLTWTTSEGKDGRKIAHPLTPCPARRPSRRWRDKYMLFLFVGSQFCSPASFPRSVALP